VRRDSSSLIADSRIRLAQVLGKLARFAKVQLQRQRAMPGQRLAYALRRDIRVAVHVAAHPGREPYQDGQAYQASAFGKR
jgi:hypothetical protein